MTERKRYFQWPGSWDSETKMIDRVRCGAAKQNEVVLARPQRAIQSLKRFLWSVMLINIEMAVLIRDIQSW